MSEVAELHPAPVQLPKPSGYQLLIGLPEIQDRFDSGLLKTAETMQNERVTSVVGFVMETGPDAYADKVKFPSGAYCKKGDFVIIGAYVGARFKIHGKEFRLIHDDSVLGVTDDPRGFSRV